MKTSESIDQLAAALTNAQGAMKNAPKDSDNPYFKSKYADLATCWDAIRLPLSSCGLSVTQTMDMDENQRLTVTTRLMHKSGQWIEGTMRTLPKEYTPQALGSATTYLRRYSLAAIVGLASEDDDGAAGSGTVKPQEQQAKAPRRAPGTVSAKEPPHEKVKQEKMAALEQAGIDAFQAAQDSGNEQPYDDRTENPRESASKRSLGIAAAMAMMKVEDAAGIRRRIVENQADGLLNEADVIAIEAAIVERIAELAGLQKGSEVKPPKQPKAKQPKAKQVSIGENEIRQMLATSADEASNYGTM